MECKFQKMIDFLLSNAGPYENQEVGIKYLAEKGVCKDNPVLKKVMEAFATTGLSDLCYRTKGKNKEGVCEAAVDENQLKGLSTYGGQQLEVDWKSSTRRLCDVTFRVLLIMYYAEKHTSD